MSAGPSGEPSLEIRPIRAGEVEAARQLLADGGWAGRVGDAERFRELVGRSQIALAAVKGAEVVGFLRGLSDGMSNGYLSMLAVAPVHRGRGIGRALVEAAMGADPEMTWALRAGREGAAAFFERLGFSPSLIAMERRRRARVS